MSSSRFTGRNLLPPVDVRSVPKTLAHTLEMVAFWAAVVLPFLHLPLLATGLDSQSTTLAFVLLVGLNVCALVLGHTYAE